jgi:SAM-dependent methyltransferase
LFVCDQCWLVQTEDYSKPDDLFCSDYAYFSSVSRSWLDHAERLVELVSRRFSLDEQSYVIEVASNDGYLLKNFVAAGIPCLGIEPTNSTAKVAEAIGIPVLREFFNRDLAVRLANENKLADIVIGNNVYAHVPDINDFTAGLKAVLKPKGIIILEFPHLLRLLEENQFDTVYHEHFSYLSLQTVSKIFERAGLKIWDVECLKTHGGSLRVYGCHAHNPISSTPAVRELLEKEQKKGLQLRSTYLGFQSCADKIKNNLLLFLIEQKRANKKLVAYGAAAKGNTLLNYAGIKPDLVSCVFDAADSKQGKYLPGSHIPILSPSLLREQKPDIVLILPWNIAEEVVSENEYVREWGGKFVISIPEIKVID